MCVNSHESCHSDEFSSTRPRTPPTRLVDVLEGRLVSQLSKADSYTALSYVWGDKPQLLLKTENEESLGKAGSLLDSNNGLPQTIKDAIQFCREIDVRYLWVDSLCIKQEDCEEKDAEISRMYEIYSQAALTLVALSATSSHCPLPGVSPNTRTWYQYREAVKGLELISCYPSLSSEVEKSVWFTRGWTFQEAAFSKRLLFFAPTQTIFLCRQTMFCEDSVWESPDAETTAASSNMPTSRSRSILEIMLLDHQPNYILKKYFLIIQEYTLRQLRYHSDMLKACNAVIQWIARDEKQGTRCLFGLPENRFALSLGWSPTRGHSCAEGVRQDQFPSWSWAGWKGPVQWNILQMAGDNGRVSDWGASGIIQDSELDEELRRKAGRTVTPVRQHPEHDNLNQPPVSDSGVLQFWTSSAHVSVSRQEAIGTIGTRTHGHYYWLHEGLPTFEILKRDGTNWYRYRLQCDPDWRSRQPDQLEFIAIGASRLKPPDPPQYEDSIGCGTSLHRARQDGRLYKRYDSFLRAFDHWKNHMQDRVVLDLMCIEWKGNVAERVQVCHSWRLEDWMALEPKEKLIRLG